MDKSKVPVHFHFVDIQFWFPKRTAAKHMIFDIIKRENRDVVEINYIFCSDAYLLHLNIGYLKHNTLTDIITFYYHAGGAPIHSDIYISIERVKENAHVFNVSFLHELHRVLFHGALHLCGYKDKTKKDQPLMRKKEAFYLDHFNVSRETKNKS